MLRTVVFLCYAMILYVIRFGVFPGRCFGIAHVAGCGPSNVLCLFVCMQTCHKFAEEIICESVSIVLLSHCRIPSNLWP